MTRGLLAAIVVGGVFGFLAAQAAIEGAYRFITGADLNDDDDQVAR